MTVRSGKFVKQYITNREDSKTLDENSVQPNGVDLSIGTLYRIDGTPRVDNSDYSKGNRVSVTKQTDEDGDYYYLDSSETYIVVYGEKIQIPRDHIGLVFPRSRLMRCGMSVETAVWDSGYKGIGEGGLDVKNDAKLGCDCRIAQITFFETESLEQQYSGSHQFENL